MEGETTEGMNMGTKTTNKMSFTFQSPPEGDRADTEVLFLPVFAHGVRFAIALCPSYRNVLRYVQILARWVRVLFATAGISHIKFV